MRWSHAAHQASARQSGNSFFLPLGWWGRLGAQRRAVWGGCERKVSWAEQWVGVWVEPSSPAWSAALTVPSLWLFSRGSWWEWGGQAAGVCLHTEPCCVPRSFQHMAEALELTKEKKKTSTKKKRCWKSTSHFVREQFFQTQACVTPSLISNVAKPRSSRFTRCIYDEPEAMIDLPVAICSRHVGMPWPKLGWGSMSAGVFTTDYLSCFMISSLA